VSGATIAMSHVDQMDFERRSSAVTLSDMEMFIFPELMYSLVLANIMSPRLWRWREDSWFSGVERMKPYRRITRLKQFIMDHYIFNLDLDTWGLTTKERELARFESFIDEETLRESNALFGYEGDKYYFDIDIRKHFGLDKYEGNVIPYWKTETIEAMDAFRYKPNYQTGAGECVSLAALYAAALFVVARIPLDDIYLMATPLHSQNFIDVNDGILTNNRRLVTKAMWCNGTALSAQARRALENERVTIVTHETGYVHTVYEEATMKPEAYGHLGDRLLSYLNTRLSGEILGNFLRHTREFQRCFQIRWPLRGVDHYIASERVFAYEHGSSYRITGKTRDKLMAEIDTEEFERVPYPERIVLNDLERYVAEHNLDLNTPGDLARLKVQFATDCLNAELAMESLRCFCHVEPRLPPVAEKRFTAPQAPLGIDLDMSRNAVVERLAQVRGENAMAEMAFHAYRDLGRTEAEPFLAAACARNPVCIKGCGGPEVPSAPGRHHGGSDNGTVLSEEEIVRQISEMDGESIYDGPGRLAQPDEVWNYRRGDGLEKAVLLGCILRHRDPEASISIDVAPGNAVLEVGAETYSFCSRKALAAQRWTIPLPS